MVTDANFHRTCTFGRHVQSDGSNIAPGSPDPANSGYLQGPPVASSSLLTFCEGSAYAAVEFFTMRPVQANTGRLQLDFTLADPMGLFYSDQQIVEHDTKLVIGGKMFNFSCQRVAATNMIQGSNQAGAWTNTWFVAPVLTPAPMPHSFVYGFDTATGRYGIEEVIIGGESWAVPFTLNELAAMPTTWPDGAYLQLQHCQSANGGKTRMLWDNVTYTWS